MLALLLAPAYLLICIYILHWMLKWMSVCHHWFGYAPFQYAFTVIYMLAATTLLTSFLVKKPLWLHRFLKQISNVWLGIFLYALIGIGIADLLRILIHFSCLADQPWYHSRIMFVFTGALTGILILIFSLYGFLHAKKLHTTTWHITSHKRCRSGKILNIALIADLHLGYSVDERFLHRIVKHINASHSDLVVIAGDTFDNEFQAIKNPEKCAGILRGLKSTYGTYCCYGNHDLDEAILAGFTFGGQMQDADKRFEQFFRSANITLLDDKVCLIDNSFYLIGRKDPSRCKKLASEKPRMTPKELTNNLDLTKPVFVIDHQPRELSELSEAGIDLTLGGHTHNGQIFPGNLILRFLWENPYGLLKKGRMYSVVTSGAGIWGPSMRIGTKGEICLIKISFKNLC